jgi:hypothetical protein
MRLLPISQSKAQAPWLSIRQAGMLTLSCDFCKRFLPESRAESRIPGTSAGIFFDASVRRFG